MTIDEIIAEVELIKAAAQTDSEEAHWREDRLHHRVMKMIADEGDLRAKECLKSLHISFPRWCA